ncbi:MAG: ABC transporter substrate-binding protein [Planctomycetes bacterium]|nr:ABC transporter substrate-binding protein [Planctomycetota bacterium]
MKKLASRSTRLLLLLTALAICGGASAATTFGIKPLDRRTTVNLGYFSGALHSVIFYIADEKGFFDELNLDVSYQSFSRGPAMMEAHSSWDFASTGGPGSLVGILAHPVKVVAITDYEKEQSLYVRADSPIFKAGNGHIPGHPEIYGRPEDWKGTTWLLPVGTTMHKVLLNVLGKLGLRPGDITMINMDVSSAFAAFRAGQGDGLGVWMSISLSAADAGFKKVAGATDEEKLVSCLLVTDAAMTNKAEAMQTVFDLYGKVMDWSREHKDEYIKYLLESCQIEGVATTADITRRLTDTFGFFSAELINRLMTTYVDDPRGLAGRKLSQGEADLLEMLDFFIVQGIYTEENRKFIIDNHKISSQLAKKE